MLCSTAFSLFLLTFFFFLACMGSTTKSKVSMDKNLNPNSPYYLHPGENLGLVLVCTTLLNDHIPYTHGQALSRRVRVIYARWSKALFVRPFWSISSRFEIFRPCIMGHVGFLLGIVLKWLSSIGFFNNILP